MAFSTIRKGGVRGSARNLVYAIVMGQGVEKMVDAREVSFIERRDRAESVVDGFV